MFKNEKNYINLVYKTNLEYDDISERNLQVKYFQFTFFRISIL